ncbi:hypothetical protein A4X16_06040 [Microbacterium sp. H83]|nr:hypothetical protein A4X16_06040 [Microbacterium sp. H83]
MGYHQIDVLCRLFGPARVTAASKHFRYPESQREDLEDLMSVSLEFERGGMSSHLLLSRHGAGKSETLEIHGTEGVIQLDARHARVTLFGRDGSVLDQYAGPDLATDSPAVVLGYYLELISDRQAALAHLRHHCSLVALCHEVYDAAARAAVGHHQSIERTEST